MKVILLSSVGRKFLRLSAATSREKKWNADREFERYGFVRARFSRGVFSIAVAKVFPETVSERAPIFFFSSFSLNCGFGAQLTGLFPGKKRRRRSLLEAFGFQSSFFLSIQTRIFFTNAD